MPALLLAALLLQAGDAVTTCTLLARPPFERNGQMRRYVEANPLMGQTCRSVVTRKSVLIVPAVIWRERRWARGLQVGLAIGGGVGFGFNATKVW